MKRGRMLKAISFIILFALVTGGVAFAADDKPIVWNFQDTYTSASWPCSHLNMPLIEWIEKATNAVIRQRCLRCAQSRRF